MKLESHKTFTFGLPTCKGAFICALKICDFDLAPGSFERTFIEFTGYDARTIGYSLQREELKVNKDIKQHIRRATWYDASQSLHVTFNTSESICQQILFSFVLILYFFSLFNLFCSFILSWNVHLRHHIFANRCRIKRLDCVIITQDR